MMNIIWLDCAKNDLIEIHDHIAQENPKAAIDTLRKITRSTNNLADHPNLGRTGRVTHTRELIISDTRYIVPYRVAGDNVEILRVLHSSRRWPSRLDAQNHFY